MIQIDSFPDSSPELRILIVDDHEDMLSMLDLMMQRRQYAVKTAQCGSDAILMAPEFAPHIVVSDIGMPGMDGFQLMEHLRATPDLAPFKSIALTGFEFQDEDDRARDAGFDAQLTKPIEFDHLFELIEQFATEMRS